MRRRCGRSWRSTWTGTLPAGRPALAQGLVAAVPAKLWLDEDGTARLICLAAYAAELQERVLQERVLEERVG